jgi:hypothetical protein
LRGVATTVLVEALQERGADGDLDEAQAAGCGELMQRYRAKAAAAGFGPLVDAVDATE